MRDRSAVSGVLFRAAAVRYARLRARAAAARLERTGENAAHAVSLWAGMVLRMGKLTLMDDLEMSGYEAGYAGKRPHESSRWTEAYDVGNNALAYVLAGWVAGRATRIIEEETKGR